MRNHLILAAIVVLIFTVAPCVVAQIPNVPVRGALDNPNVLAENRTIDLVGGLVTKKQEITTHGVLHTILWITAPEQIFSAVQDKPTRFIVVAILGRSNVRELSLIDIRNTKLGSVVSRNHQVFYNMIGGRIVVRK